jgi:DNA polymerase-3 subunit alpha (Gram-positive type)
MTGGRDKVRMKIEELERRPDLKAAEKDLLTALEVCYEFYLRGFSFAPIDLAKSDPVKFTIDDGRLRPPFIAISGLGEAAARDIAAQRGKNFLSIEEFSMACPKVSKAHIEQLKKAGAFGDMPECAQLSFF